MIHALIY